MGTCSGPPPELPAETKASTCRSGNRHWFRPLKDNGSIWLHSNLFRSTDRPELEAGVVEKLLVIRSDDGAFERADLDGHIGVEVAAVDVVEARSPRVEGTGPGRPRVRGHHDILLADIWLEQGILVSQQCSNVWWFGQVSFLRILPFLSSFIVICHFYYVVVMLCLHFRLLRSTFFRWAELLLQKELDKIVKNLVEIVRIRHELS